jgi:hypothetical protein
MSVALVVWSKSKVRGHLITGIVGSNPTVSMDILLLCLLCVVYVVAPVTHWSLIKIPARYISLTVCDLQTLTIRLPRFDMECCAAEKYLYGTLRW